MRDHIGRSVGFFRTTAIGGLLFLLPLAVVAGLLGYVYSFAVVTFEPLQEWIPVKTATGITLIFLASLSLLVLACFVAGLMAQRAIGRRASRLIEQYLSTLFPKYAIYKDLLAGNIGGKQHVPTLQPILVNGTDEQRPAFEADRLRDGSVVVYFPGAPDSWIGHVGIVPAERVVPLAMPFNDLVGVLEQLGRGASSRLPD